MFGSLFPDLDATRIGRFEAAWYFHCFVTELVLIYPVFGILMLESVSRFEFSLLLAIWAGFSIFLEIPLGALGDRFDRRKLLTISGLIEGGCFIAWLLIPGFWGYLLGFATWAVAGTLQSGTSESLIYDVIRKASGQNPDRAHKVRWIESIYTRIYGRSLAARTLGATLALLLGGYAAEWIGFSWVLILSVVAPLLGALVLWSLIRDPRSGSEDSTRRFMDVVKCAAGEILPNPVLRHSVLAFAALGATFAALEDFIPPFYQEKEGISLGVIGVIWGISYLGASVGLLLAERMKFSRDLFIHLLMLLGASLLLVCVATPAALGMVALVGYFFICSICFVHLQTRMQMRMQGGARATLTSVAWMLDAVIGVVFYLIMGAVAEAYNWHASFVVMGLLTAACALTFGTTSAKPSYGERGDDRGEA